MSGGRIFIVEDERIVAEDLRGLLQKMGYEVVGSAANGEEALRQIEATRPDLVFMDIRIEGDMDGTEVAEAVVARFDIPVTFLTAFSDEETLERAKGALPYGYLLKPFDERMLKTTVEVALHRQRMDRLMSQADYWNSLGVQSLPEPVVVVDREDRIRFLNHVAEDLLGWRKAEGFGRRFSEVFDFQKGIFLSGLSKTASESFDVSSRPLKNSEGGLLGQVFLFRKKPFVPEDSKSRAPFR